MPPILLSLHIEGMSGPSSHAPRNQAIEALRILAAFAIVAFHAQTGDYRWWHSGLVVFVFLAAMFGSIPRDEPRPVLPILRRLLVPFVFWYAVYLAANFVLGRPLLLADNWVTAVLAGPSFHLWFLPFAALILVLATQISRLSGLLQPLTMAICGAAGFGLLFTSASWFPLFWDLPAPMTQWGHAIPAALLGIFVASIIRGGGNTLLAGVVCIWPALIARQFGISSIELAYYAGFFAIALAMILSRFWPRNLCVQPIADCMFGVYLTHIITLAIAARLVERGSIAQVAIAFALSLAGVWAARRFVPLAKTVLG